MASMCSCTEAAFPVACRLNGVIETSRNLSICAAMAATPLRRLELVVSACAALLEDADSQDKHASARLS